MLDSKSIYRMLKFFWAVLGLSVERKLTVIYSSLVNEAQVNRNSCKNKNENMSGNMHNYLLSCLVNRKTDTIQRIPNSSLDLRQANRKHSASPTLMLHMNHLRILLKMQIQVSGLGPGLCISSKH